MAAIKIAKKELRQLISKSLKEIPAESIISQSQHSPAIARQDGANTTAPAGQIALNILFSTPEYVSAKRISVYLSMPVGEILTAPIVEDALRQNKKVFVPCIGKAPLSLTGGHPTSIMDMVALHSKADFEAFSRDSWGIPVPSKDSISGRENCLGDTGRGRAEWVGIEEGEGGLDLIVIPGMAFDTALRRLGHGKGYYDFFLQRYSNSRKKGTLMPCLGQFCYSH
jgi:5-formyltetrahydrofolate cyclo-ligase